MMLRNGQQRGVPTHVIDAMERLYVESPSSMVAFYEWIVEPSHTQTVTLRFFNGRLVLSELTRTAK
jgi:hypothetical protein